MTDDSHIIGNADLAELTIGRLREMHGQTRRHLGADAIPTRAIKALIDLKRQTQERARTGELPGMLTPDQFAEYLGIARRTLHDWLTEQRVPPPVYITDIAPRYLVRDIQAWEQAGCPKWDDYKRNQQHRERLQLQRA
jgi:predicted DNA-binding transcriptional regulator AlpA